MRLGILALSVGGKQLSTHLAALLPEAETIQISHNIGSTLAESWQKYDGFICIMATGIVVRSIVPLLTNKKTDPAIVVLDEKGLFVISLLSGHLGGGNALARRISTLTGGQAVITTASDTLGLVALDLWAQSQYLVPHDARQLTRASAKLVNTGQLTLFSDVDIADLPDRILQTAQRDKADIIISLQKNCGDNQLILHPKIVVIGTGCNRDTPAHEFSEALHELFTDLGISTLSVCSVCSIDKKSDEKGLLEFATMNNWPTRFFTKEQINTYTHLEISQAALQAVGALGVAEPTALLGAGQTSLFCRKRKWKNITMAVALAPFTLSAQAQVHSNI